VGTNNANKWHNFAQEQGLWLAQLTDVILFINYYNYVQFVSDASKYSNMRNCTVHKQTESTFPNSWQMLTCIERPIMILVPSDVLANH